MNTPSNFSYHPGQSAVAEQILYDYLVKIVQASPCEEVLQDFRRLFVEGRECSDSRVYSALDTLVKSKDASERFVFFLNRCCHILINRWQIQPQSQAAILELVDLLQAIDPAQREYYPTSNRVRHLVKKFTESEQFLQLQRLARVMNAKLNANPTNSVGSLIYRYPYLYSHCLLGDDSSREHRQTVKRLQTEAERAFEVQLSRYLTDRVRLAQGAGSPLSSLGMRPAIEPAKNPTLLSDRQLNRSLQHYAGKVEGGYTYKSLSENFLTDTAHAKTYKTVKEDLYEYLIGSIPSRYGKSQFNQKLHQRLQTILPEADGKRPDEFLMLRTSSQLLNFLVVESSQHPEHYTFIDMIANMGVTRSIGLLLKLVLICHKVKPYLEKRFSILFNHYESSSRDGVPWLVNALENLQVAFSIHFGKLDLSGLNQLS